MNLLNRTRLLLTLGCLAVASPAGAVGTRYFELDSGSDFEGGDLQGTSIVDSGEVRAGMRLGSVPLTGAQQTIWAALDLGDGRTLLALGSEGRLVTVKGEKVEPAGDVGGLAATSLVRAWDGLVLVGVLPGNKLMSWKDGKLTEFVQLPGVEHIWGLAWDASQQVVYVVTGPEGKLWRITRDKHAEVFFDAEQDHLVSVAVGPKGVVYAGASDRSILYRVTGPGRAEVVRDFGLTEVRALAVSSAGEVWAVVNDIRRSRASSSSSADRTRSKSTTSSSSSESSSERSRGTGVLYRIGLDGRVVEVMTSKEEHLSTLALDEHERPLVGTGAEGRLLTVDARGTKVLLADSTSRGITALLPGKQVALFASDPPAVLPILGVGGAQAIWTSKVLDAGLSARFGRLSWVADGKLEFETRTGQTREPDGTWSPWSAPLAAPNVVTSPRGRYVQLRARWSRDAGAVLREVKLPFVTENQPVRLRSIDAEASGRTKPTRGGIESSGGPLSSSGDGKVRLSWKAEDADDDSLRYELFYQLEGTPDWIPVLSSDDVLDKSSYSWDTKELPEGMYRVKVVAFDDLANPLGDATRDELVSSLIPVDNTQPTLSGLRVEGRRLVGTALDGVGPIQRIEISQPGTSRWFPVAPTDGVFDGAREGFSVDLSKLPPLGKGRLYVIRVWDAAGNSTLGHVTAPASAGAL